MIDFHNHLLPAVDDGASDLAESRAALGAMREAGIHTVITSPHLQASLLGQADQAAERLAAFDAAFSQVKEMGEAEFPGLRLERGVELMLDTPNPDLSDPRVRLAGTSFLLLEFPGMTVPPHSVQALYELKLVGWRPIIAHPERYHNLNDLGIVDEWRSIGCLLQLNCGSILGRYGQRAEDRAWSLLGNGWVDYLSSDYHARGRLTVGECRDLLVGMGGERQARLLLEENAARLLAGEEPEPVPPLERRASIWKKLFRRSG